ncbi:MAG: serine hydrolase [Bryobacteraceae bacterium]
MFSFAKGAALAALLVCGLHAASLSEALHARIAGFPGTVSLYAKNLDSGASIGIRKSAKVRTASTVKLPTLVALFDAVARGEAKWTELLTVTAAEKVTGSGIIGSEVSDGVQLPLRDVANLMIVLSDNTATNMIIQRIGADTVNAYLNRIGIHTTRLMRKVRGDGSELKAAEGWSAAGKLPKNRKYGLGVSTPRDMVAILEKLERGELVSPEASRDILSILKRNQDNTGIRRRLGDLPIANKSGALDALRSDVGIVYSKAGRIAMAITVDGIPQPDWGPDNPGSILISDLAKLLVEGLAQTSPAEK